MAPGYEVSISTIRLDVGFRSTKKFTQVNTGVMPWVFYFNPGEIDVGSYFISLTIVDRKTKKATMPIPWSINVISFN